MRDIMTPNERRAKAQWLIDHINPDDKEELERIHETQEMEKAIAKCVRRRERIERNRREEYEWDMVAPWVDRDRGTKDHPEIAGW